MDFSQKVHPPNQFSGHSQQHRIPEIVDRGYFSLCQMSLYSNSKAIKNDYLKVF